MKKLKSMSAVISAFTLAASGSMFYEASAADNSLDNTSKTISVNKFCDIDGDGAVNAADATKILIGYAEALQQNKKPASAVGIELSDGDADGDGTVNAADATKILIGYAEALQDDKNKDNSAVLTIPDKYYSYGTMNIPYTDFYAAEKITADTVDAVSSATKSHWKSNEEGEIAAGSYNKANDDGTGTILGVTYPVKIWQSVLKALGTDNYSFDELKDTPKAYKEAIVSNGKLSFSDVKGGTTKEITGVTATISTDTPWGDYIIEPKDPNSTQRNGMYSPGTIYGAILTTKEGHSYAMRHLQNIWVGEFAWSSGFVTKEPHGNVLDSKDYAAIMGETITSIKYITADGYQTLATNLYVPIKTSDSATVTNAAAGTGSTDIKIEGLPEDFKASYKFTNAAGKEVTSITTDGSKVNYTDALPGSYTLTISDTSGKYASFDTTFILSSETGFVEAGENAVVAKADAPADALENYISNITSVDVSEGNGESKTYATGRRGTTIIKADGTVDTAVKTGRGTSAKAVFESGKTYKLVVKSAGSADITLTVTIA